MTEYNLMPLSKDIGPDREDYAYMNEVSQNVLAGGYIAPDVKAESVKEAAIERVNFLISHAEKILGRELPTMRLGVKRGWVSPSSPVWANFGTERGLPISCNGSFIDDTVDSIAYKVAEISMMTKEGAGTSAYMGALRASGAPISGGGKSKGPVHFASLIQEAVQVISQSNVRRGNAAIYLDIDHPDIDEWLKMRSITNKVFHKIQHLSFGVVISDEWMNAMMAEQKGGEKRRLMARIINKRREEGYPYIIFSGNANNARHPRLKELGLEIKASNLCTEIMLPSTPDESFVCNLSSLNLLYFDEWKNTPLAREMVYFLDAVMTEYIQKCHMPGRRLLADAARFAERWRAIGVGTLGYHSYLQWHMIPFRSERARELNIEMHKHIHDETLAASREMAEIYGEAPGMIGTGQRHLALQAVAPTRSSSLILGQVSKGIEPWVANIFEDDNAKTTFTKINQALKTLLKTRGLDTPEVWDAIIWNGGSVLGLPYLSEDEQRVFETFLEVGPDEIIQQNNDRTPYVDQGISLNLQIDPSASKKQNFEWIVKAWKGGSKSLYYHEGVNASQKLLLSNNDCAACQA